jgi:predicted nucleic acid binding AN1-type Zn finger protein
MKCTECKKKTHLDLKCNYCNNVYCTSCLHLENHNCGYIHEYKQKRRDLLSTVLHVGKTKDIKVTKI